MCPACGEPNPAPREVNWLGRSTDEPAPDRERHAYRLAERKRCPACASWLEDRSPNQRCRACGDALFNDPRFLEGYHRHLGGKLPRVLTISWLWSLIPVVGLVPGVIYYRLTLVAPYRRYLPSFRRFGTKWGLRVVLFILLALQWVPVLGSVTVPLMALLSFTVHRRVFNSLMETGHGGTGSPAQDGGRLASSAHQ